MLGGSGGGMSQGAVWVLCGARAAEGGAGVQVLGMPGLSLGAS